MPRDQVERIQRERLMAAAAELMAENGYAAMKTAEIAKRAGISLESFYGLFKDKEEVIYAGYDRFIEVLLQRQRAVLGETRSWREFIEMVITGYLTTLASDLVVSRAFKLEMDALGAPARVRRRQSLRSFAEASAAVLEHLKGVDPLLNPPDFDRAVEIHLAGTYAASQLACDALDESPEPDLAALAPDLIAWLTAGMYGGQGDSPARS